MYQDPKEDNSPIESQAIAPPEPSDESVTLTNGESVVEPVKKKSKVPIIASVVILLMAVVGVAALIVFLPKNSNNDVSQNHQDTQEEIEPLSDLRLAGNGLSDFDLEFLKSKEADGNVVYSPLSIKYALGMLADGAQGDSKTQITSVTNDYQPKAYLNSANRSLANAMFVRNDFSSSIRKSYADDIRTKYGASVIYDSFETPDNVNKWVSDQTLGIVHDMFDNSSLNPDFSFVLVNALAIDMNWKNQLLCEALKETERAVPCKSEYYGIYSVEYAHENTDANQSIGPIYDSFEKMVFNNVDGVPSARLGATANRYDIINELGEDYIRETVQAEYEKWLKENAEIPEDERSFDIDAYIDALAKNYGRFDQSTDFYFYDSDAEKVFAKDLQTYDGVTLQYVGIMPKSEELGDYITNMTAEKTSTLINNLKDADSLDSYKEGVVTKVFANIPFFKFDYKIDNLINGLRKLGISDVFLSEKADLSAMINTDEVAANTSIEEVIHKADIEFSNNGIRAAAATGMGGFGSARGGFEYLWDVPIEEIDMTFDQPFWFLIRDKDSGEVWFIGSVRDLANA